MGVLSGALNVIGGALLIFGTYVGPLYSVATAAAGLMMLLLAATQKEPLHRGTAFAGMLLVLLSMMGTTAGVWGVLGKVGGALAWPVFAIPYYKESAGEEQSPRKTMAGLVFVAGVVQLAGSFIAMPDMVRITLSMGIGAVQAVMAWVLQSEQPAA